MGVIETKLDGFVFAMPENIEEKEGVEGNIKPRACIIDRHADSPFADFAAHR